MLRSTYDVTRFLLLTIPLLAGCLPASDAHDYKTVRAYDRESGKYFDVKVPYHSTLTTDGSISREEPSREEIDRTVDKARIDSELGSAVQNVSRQRTSSGCGGCGGPGAARVAPSGPSPFDRTTSGGSSYHDADSPFGEPSRFP